LRAFKDPEDFILFQFDKIAKESQGTLLVHSSFKNKAFYCQIVSEINPPELHIQA